MAESAMVTGRMSKEKKEEGNRVLASLGSSPSKAINQLYDFVIAKRALPFEEKPARRSYSKEEIAEAVAWARSLRGTAQLSGKWATMTIKEAKRERLIAKGLMEGLS